MKIIRNRELCSSRSRPGETRPAKKEKKEKNLRRRTRKRPRKIKSIRKTIE
jgi:hypothetical protein